jgi:hypothetical protein
VPPHPRGVQRIFPSAKASSAASAVQTMIIERYSGHEALAWAAVRMVRTLRAELGTEHGTVGRVARQLGYGVESVRSWVNLWSKSNNLSLHQNQGVSEDRIRVEMGLHHRPVPSVTSDDILNQLPIPTLCPWTDIHGFGKLI